MTFLETAKAELVRLDAQAALLRELIGRYETIETRKDGEANSTERPGPDKATPQVVPIAAPPGAPTGSLVGGLTPAQSRVLHALLHGHSRMVPITTAAQVPSGSVTSIVLALEKKGLAVNKGVPAHPLWEPTDKGREVAGLRPPMATPGPGPAPQTTAADAPIEPQDLNVRQRLVLVALRREDFVKVAEGAGIKPGELPSILVRLRGLGLVEAINGGWAHTRDGERILAALKAHPLKAAE